MERPGCRYARAGHGEMRKGAERSRGRNASPMCFPVHQLQPPRSALPVRFFRYNLSGLGIGMQPFGLYYCGAPTKRRPEMRATRATSLNAPRHTSDSDILACSRLALSCSRLLRIPGCRNRSAVYLLMYWCIPAYKPTRLGVLTSRFHASMLEALALAPTRELSESCGALRHLVCGLIVSMHLVRTTAFCLLPYYVLHLSVRLCFACSCTVTCDSHCMYLYPLLSLLSIVCLPFPPFRVQASAGSEPLHI
jgi:hypothetical protein